MQKPRIAAKATIEHATIMILLISFSRKRATFSFRPPSDWPGQDPGRWLLNSHAQDGTQINFYILPQGFPRVKCREGKESLPRRRQKSAGSFSMENDPADRTVSAIALLPLPHGRVRGLRPGGRWSRRKECRFSRTSTSARSGSLPPPARSNGACGQEGRPAPRSPPCW